MTWPYCESRNGRPHKYPVIADGWPHCERLDGIASQISFSTPQSIIIYTPTYLLPNSSDRRPNFMPVLVVVGGGSWCLNHGPLAHRFLRRCSRLFQQSDHLVPHQILRRYCGAVPLSFFDRDPCSCPSAPLWDPQSLPPSIFRSLRLIHGHPGYPDVLYH